MKRPISLLFFILSAIMMIGSHAKAYSPPPPTIEDISILTPEVEQWEKFEVTVDLTASYNNPYDYDQILVSAIFTSPSGNSKSIDGFFMQDYTLNSGTGNLTPTGPGEFRLRFAPDELGNWSFVVTVMDASGSVSSEAFTFQCTAITTSANHGFLRTGASNYLQFDDEAPYIAIGENMAWQNNNAYLNYQNWLEGLIESGGNFFRLWHAHWGLGVEWRNGNGFQGLRRYKQSNCYYQDWLFDYCAENGVYIMLALQHHGPVSTQVNPNWNESPYNVSNGGPCQNTVDFFTNEEARAHTKNRYRYIVARWGYARSILCWELFNEVHWTDNFQTNQAFVANWHFEMAEYLKSIDPNSHIVTTSYGGDLTDENVWEHPDFDLTQSHIYLDNSNIERALAQGNRNFLNEFGKPTLNGEFGLGTSASLANQDPDGIHLHNALWGGLFSGALGTAMTWWWDNYIHPQNLYFHFTGLSQIVEEVPFLAENLSPANAYTTGAPGDLTLSPSLGWASIGEANIAIDENGLITPEGAALGQFLYGSQWNTQYRSPPTFGVSYSSAGTFTVTTANETGTNPKIAIWLDGNLELEQDASPNSHYTITIPAGMHTIRVDNTGTDWITISSYTFEGLGSMIDAYVLVSEGQNLATGWALNHMYNHQNVLANGEPNATPPSSIIVDGFQNGSYSVHYFDPMTGVLFGGDEAIASGGSLNIPLPEFLWDVAFIVDDTPVAIWEERRNDLAFEVYPNPALAGTDISLRLSDEVYGSNPIALLDMGGKEIYQATTNNGQLRLPSGLPAGLYWIKMAYNGKIGSKPIVIVEGD